MELKEALGQRVSGISPFSLSRSLVMLIVVIVFNDGLQNNPNVAKSTAEAVLSVMNTLSTHVFYMLILLSS